MSSVKEVTPEELYDIWFTQINLIKGRFVRHIKNFDKIKKTKVWIYFDSCSDLINRNSGQIDPVLYMKALATHFGGWFNPNCLSSIKSIQIYKKYVKGVNISSSEEFITSEILRSIKFVIYHCKKHNIPSFNAYMNNNIYLIPTILKHFNAGSISLYFLYNIPNITLYLDNYPQDCVDDYLKDFKKDFDIFRVRVLSIEKLKKLCDNIELVIDKKIKE